MLSLEDCIALSELSEAEILAIAEHEGIPEMAAAEMGNYLVQSPTGEVRLRAMIVDDIHDAEARGDTRRVLALKLVCKKYLGEHPTAERRNLARD
jgi:DNA repair protein RadC